MASMNKLQKIGLPRFATAFLHIPKQQVKGSRQALHIGAAETTNRSVRMEVT